MEWDEYDDTDYTGRKDLLIERLNEYSQDFAKKSLECFVLRQCLEALGYSVKETKDRTLIDVDEQILGTNYIDQSLTNSKETV